MEVTTQSDGRTKNILLVEDNEDDVFAFKRALRKAGITALLQVVMDGRKAIEFLETVVSGADPVSCPRPALVFLDLKLPYHDGMEILEWARGQSTLHDIPVVVLSGSDEPRDRHRAHSLGARGYLVKPAAPGDLRREING